MQTVDKQISPRKGELPPLKLLKTLRKQSSQCTFATRTGERHPAEGISWLFSKTELSGRRLLRRWSKHEGKVYQREACAWFSELPCFVRKTSIQSILGGHSFTLQYGCDLSTNSPSRRGERSCLSATNDFNSTEEREGLFRKAPTPIPLACLLALCFSTYT